MPMSNHILVSLYLSFFSLSFSWSCSDFDSPVAKSRALWLWHSLGVLSTSHFVMSFTWEYGTARPQVLAKDLEAWGWLWPSTRKLVTSNAASKRHPHSYSAWCERMHNSQQINGTPPSLAAATPSIRNIVSSAYKESREKQHGQRHAWRWPKPVLQTSTSQHLSLGSGCPHAGRIINTKFKCY